MRPKLPKLSEVQKYLLAVDAAGVYSNRGPLVRSLELRYAEYLGVEPEQVVACSSGTAGLTGAVQTARARHFFVQDFTFAATPLAVLASGKDLSFIDVSAEDLCSAHAVSEGNAYVITLPFGSDFEPLTKLASFSGELIIDAAASLGNSSGALRSMARGWTVVFSLHATKVFGIGEGGLVVFGDSNQAEKFRSWINFGYKEARIATYRGVNAKMSEIAAAYGHAVLDGAEREVADWKKSRAHANEISLTHGLVAITGDKSNISPYWIVRFNSYTEAQAVQSYLSSKGIESRRWWSSACHEMPAFRDIEIIGNLEVSSVMSRCLLGLPFFRGQTSEDFREIGNAIDEVASSF